MEETKIYAIVRSSGSFSIHFQDVMGFCLSKKSAEFEVWRLNKEINVSRYGLMGSGFTSYSVQEISAVSPRQVDEKEYKKFLKEKSAEIESEIKKKEECSTKDVAEIEKLKKELELINK